MRMRLGSAASALGKGIMAGLAGTAAMTLSSTLESKISGRKPSDAPAKAAGKVLGVSPVGEDEKKRFGNLVHWGYGTAWGAARGLLTETGLSWPAATATHFAAVWGTEAVMLPAMGVAPLPTKWGVKEILIDGWHHLVYALGAGAAYYFIDRSDLQARAEECPTLRSRLSEMTRAGASRVPLLARAA